jgi:hypothetical protein
MSQNSDTKQATGTNVLAEVATALQASTGDVRKRLVHALTERELVKRVDLLDKALTKRTQLQQELNSLRLPTKKAFKLVDGKMVESEEVVTYTPEEAKKYAEDLKAHTKKVKEATEKLANFDKVLEVAFVGDSTNPDALGKAFDKLGKMVSGKDTPAEEASE